MGDNTEDLGSIGVSVVADYSAIEGQWSQLQQQAAAAGANVAEAFTSAAQSSNVLEAAVSRLVAGATTWEEALNAVSADTAVTGAAAMAAAEQMDLFGASVAGIPWSDATGQLTLFTDELEPFTAEAVGAASAANELATSEVKVAAATSEATQQVEKAATSTQDLVQSLVAVGAAMVIVNQIEALGSAALEAADDITRAQVSLTVLTGSSAQASEEIGKLEELAQQDGLAMPALLTASTRMQALLGAAAPVPAIMAELANSAAVSGQGIGNAASAFDRMAASGTAAARTLLPLGINLEDLSKAFNQLSGTSVSTESNVASLFKQLSETERIDVLNQALQKLNGIAAQVKNETFGGQFASLVAQWTQVMAEAGDALLPVIDDLIDITKTDIVPFVKGAIEVFQAMPGPVKDITIGLGLAGTAAIALAAALGTLGIALGGVKALMSTLGIQTVTTELTAAGEAATAAGTAMAGAATAGAVALTGAYVALALASLDVFVKEAQLVDAWKGAANQQNQLQAGVQKMIDTLQAQGINVSANVEAFNRAIQSGTDYGTAVTQLNKDLLALVQAHQGATFSVTTTAKALDLASDSVKKISDAARQNVIDFGTAVEAYNRLNAAFAQGKASEAEVAQALADVNTAFSKIPGTAEPVSLALANQAQKMHNVGLEYQTALAVFQQVDAAYRAGTATYSQVIAAQEKLASTEQDAANAGVAIPGTLQAIDAAAQAVTASYGALASSQEIATAKAAAQQTAIQILSQETIVLGQKLVLLEIAEKDASAAADAGTGSYKDLWAIQDAIAKTSTELASRTIALEQAQLNQGTATAAAAGQVGLLGQALAQANLDMQRANAEAAAGTISAGAYATAQKNVETALENLHQAQADTNANTSRSTDLWAADAVAVAQAEARLADLTVAYQNHLATIQSVEAAKKTLLSAQIAEDQENAIAATGTKGLTDAVSLNVQILAAAKAKLEDLKQATNNQTVSAQELLAAENAVTTATNNLDAAEAAAVNPIDSATAAILAQIDALNKQAAAAQAANDKLDNFIELSDSMAGNTPGITIAGGGKTVYSLGQAPHYQGAGSILNSQFLESGLVQPGSTMSQDDLNALVARLDSITASSGATGAALEKLQAAAVAYYEKTFNLPTLADLVGAAAASGATGSTTVVQAAAAAGSASQSTGQAVNGGTYSDVTAHQAAGEIWTVAIASGSTGLSATVSAGGTSLDGASSALAATSTAQAVSVAAGALSGSVNQIYNITGILATVASQVANVAATVASRNVTGTVQNLSAGQGGATGTGSAGGSSGSATTGVLDSLYQQQVQLAMSQAAAAGVVWDGSVPWDHKAPPLPTLTTVDSSQASAIPGSAAGGGGGGLSIGTLSIQVDAAGANGTPKDIADAITEAVTKNLVQNLRVAGAHF